MIFFSLIIPTYNRVHLITKTLESVRCQTFKDVEVIIIDDGSTDGTGEHINHYIQKHELRGWYYTRTNNCERGAARNTGIRMATGQFITFLDSDDLIYETHLQKAHDYLSSKEQVKVLHSAYEIQTHNGTRKIHYKKTLLLNKQVLDGNLLSCFGMFIQKAVFDQTMFNENRKLSGSEDWLLWLKLSVHYDIYLQNEITGCLVEHSERSVLNFTPVQLRERASMMREQLQNDTGFMHKYGQKTVTNIYAHMLSYGALHLILSKNKRQGVYLFGKAVSHNYKELFSKRTVGILKHLLF
ncbi:MAG: glycosyltransferase family A protein [bacterium]|nr:glycosyltransferase family A protein [bacterium]